MVLLLLLQLLARNWLIALNSFIMASGLLLAAFAIYPTALVSYNTIGNSKQVRCSTIIIIISASRHHQQQQHQQQQHQHVYRAFYTARLLSLVPNTTIGASRQVRCVTSSNISSISSSSCRTSSSSTSSSSGAGNALDVLLLQ